MVTTTARPRPRSASPGRAPRRIPAARPQRPPRLPLPRGSRLRLAAPHRRLHAILLAVTFVVIIFAVRLVELQGIDGRVYARQATAQYLHTQTLPAPRGEIVDRDGAVLAASVDARDIVVDPSITKDSTDPTPQAIAAKLARVLHVPASRLLGPLTGSGRFAYLARGVTPQIAAAVLALDLPGVAARPVMERVYPNGDLGAQVIGFVGTDGNGLGGLEYAYNRQLVGKPGKRTVETGSNGTVLPDGTTALVEPTPGVGLQLTLDRDIQWKAEQALAAQVAATGAEGGTVIVMRPSTGEILAMASVPTFDPAHPESAPPGLLGNPAVSDVFEPGSTAKVITMAAAIDSGILTPTSPIDVPPTLQRVGRTFHDAEPHGEEHLTLTGVLAESSNIGAILASEKIGTDRLYHYLRAFGLGEPTGLHFPGESAGMVGTPATWSASQRYTIPYGQGIAVTALQVADVYATIANGGVRVTPRLVKGFLQPDGTIDPAPPPDRTRVISATTAAALEEMLEAVTTDQGTAPEARIPGYRVAGKTGTAQRVDPSCGCYRGYTASFVGFAPADDPQLLALVVLDNPVNGHFGGAVAAPVFRDVMSFALETLKIPPTGTTPPSLPLRVSPDGRPVG